MTEPRLKPWERQLRGDLRPPYRGALYQNKRSGIEWEVWELGLLKEGVISLRRERRLKGGFGWFRFYDLTVDQLGRNWRYVGPTPRDHYLWGYDLGDPTDQPAWIFEAKPEQVGGSGG